jgi:CubicO group peptidase (beta-lactamase class C family)
MAQMRARVVAAVTAGLALTGCGSRAAAPVEQTGVWRLVPPGREHVDPKRLAAAGAWADRGVPSLTALLVARHGRLVFERYYHLGAANQREPILSITKSVVSTLVGIALGEGRLKTLDLKVGHVLGGEVPKGADPRVRSITLRELLTMTSGFGSAATDPFGDGGNAYRTTPNWVRTILGSPLARPPGESFYYDNGDAHLVSALLQRVTGTTTATFAREKLFRPLRIDPGSWWADRQGVTDGSAGLQLKPRDLAKLGELYLRHGRWAGRQVVPSWFVREATSPHVSATDTQAGLGYGYFWWTYQGIGLPRLLLAIGSGGQLLIVAPTIDAVVVLTSSSESVQPDPSELELARRVLDAVRS